MDRDPDWIRIQWGSWILIQAGINDPQKYKKFNKFHFLRCWMFSLRAEVICCTWCIQNQIEKSK